ncbi:MAG: Smr/MutS family protein [Bacilli bacterium]
MKNSFDDVFPDRFPYIDLHGETSDSLPFLINDYINDNYKLGNQVVVIIHGIGLGVLKKEVQNCLKSNKKVSSYHVNFYNAGCTMVYINKAKNI